MNDEKKIAEAILKAQQLRNDSYNPDHAVTSEGYERSIEDCLMEACKLAGLSKNMWALLGLAMHWWNDIQLWAEDILAGRKVEDGCGNTGQKEPNLIKVITRSSTSDIISHEEGIPKVHDCGEDMTKVIAKLTDSKWWWCEQCDETEIIA